MKDYHHWHYKPSVPQSTIYRLDEAQKDVTVAFSKSRTSLLPISEDSAVAKVEYHGPQAACNYRNKVEDGTLRTLRLKSLRI